MAVIDETVGTLNALTDIKLNGTSIIGGTGANATQITGTSVSSNTIRDRQTLVYSSSAADFEKDFYCQSFWQYSPNIYGGNNTLTVIGNCPTAINTVATAATPDTVGSNPPNVRFQTATAASSSAGITPNSATGFLALAETLTIRWTLKLNQTTSMRIWIGITDNGLGGGTTSVAPFTTFRSDTPGVNFAGFRYSTAAADSKYMCVTATSGGQTATAETTATHVDTNYHVFELQFDGTNVIFIIDGQRVGSQSTNLMTTTTLCQPFWALDNIATLNNVPIVFCGGMRGVHKY